MTELGNADRLFAELDAIDANWDRYEHSLHATISALSGTSIGIRQSRILAGFWLLHHVHQVHAWFVGRHDAAAPNTWSGDSAVDIPIDRATHMHRVVGDVGAWGRRSTVMSGLLESGTIPQTLSLVTAGDSNAGRPLRSFVLSRTTSRNRDIWISHPYLKCSPGAAMRARLQSRSWAHWTDLHLDVANLGAEVDMQRRISLCREVAVSDVVSLVCATIPLYLPVAYGEALPRTRAAALDGFAHHPEVLFTANALQYHLGHQVLAAEWSARGTRLVAQQHGGHTGLDVRHALEDLEVRCVDRYYTYGWTDSRPNIAPLPTAMPATASSTDRRRLLVMSLEASDVVYRVQPFCIPDHARECLNATRTFLDELGDDSGYAPVVRSGVREHALIGAAVPRDDSSVTGTVSASASGLVVHNYFGTSWLETLAMNVPTVCIVPPNIHRFREAARPLVDALRRHGIIHDDPRAAARFVRELGGDARAWWLQPDLQSDRARFVSTYANYSDDWLERWRSELTALAD
jgi:putative transferase (TIGR04331 family)